MGGWALGIPGLVELLEPAVDLVRQQPDPLELLGIDVAVQVDERRHASILSLRKPDFSFVLFDALILSFRCAKKKCPANALAVKLSQYE